jgi:hypothetical protein
MAKLMTSTFYSLLPLADLETKTSPEPKTEIATETTAAAAKEHHPLTHPPALNYNIQIHLPATKDIEVFNAIFKSLREHLLD